MDKSERLHSRACLRYLPKSVIREKGMPPIGFSASNETIGVHLCVNSVSLGQFLCRPQNQKGLWRIDGGWGGPPGPWDIRWREDYKAWEYGGYCRVEWVNDELRQLTTQEVKNE